MEFTRLLQEEKAKARRQWNISSKQEHSSMNKVPVTTLNTTEKQQEQSNHTNQTTTTGTSIISINNSKLDVWYPRTKLTLESFRIGPLSIPSIYYLPNFLTNEEEKSILKCIYAYPSETIKENEPNIWVQLKNRRLQMWGGIVKIPFEPVPLPKWLQQITKSLVEAGIFAFDHEPNHVLINEYAPGQGIMPHEDGPNYFPFVAILSTQANARMTFQPHREYEKSGTHETFAFQVERRSLLLFTEKAYTEYLHSIDQVMDAKRISLTIRLVRNGLISNQNDV